MKTAPGLAARGQKSEISASRLSPQGEPQMTQPENHNYPRSSVAYFPRAEQLPVVVSLGPNSDTAARHHPSTTSISVPPGMGMVTSPGS